MDGNQKLSLSQEDLLKHWPSLFLGSMSNDLLKDWQEILSLRDWDVRLTVARARDMVLKEVEGEVEWELASKQAVIRILDPADYPPSPWGQDVEETLVHELLHLHFAPVESVLHEAGEYAKVSLEQAIHAISRALVRLRRNGRGEGRA